jgi:hypothetical protein
VFLNGRPCKLVVTEEVRETVDGQAVIKVITRPHPLYYKVAELHKQFDTVIQQSAQKAAGTNTFQA